MMNRKNGSVHEFMLGAKKNRSYDNNIEDSNIASNFLSIKYHDHCE